MSGKKKKRKKAASKASDGRPSTDLSISPQASVLLPSQQENLSAYLASLKNYPLLSPENEKAVAIRYYEDKDPEAARELALANLRLVVKIANEYVRTGLQLLDLIQEGNIGLLQAVQEYDPYRGVKFSSYASYWIKAYIRAFILKNWSLVKMGTTRAQRTLFYKLQKEKNRLEALGQEPNVRYLAEKFQVKEKEVEEMSQRLSGRDVSLHTPVGQESGQTELLHLVEDESAAIDDSLSRREISEEFSERLDSFERTLSGKELVVFRERLRAENPQTLQEIGNRYGVTRERVRQIEARLVEKLKAYMKQNAKFMENVIDV